jgi:hypothetical protein
VPSLDLRPPPIALDGAIAWVLVCAFGPLSSDHDLDRAGGEALALSKRLGLAPRIGGRVAKERLERDRGSAAAESFLHEHWETAAREGVLERAVARLSSVAHATGTPLVLLKHAALRAARITRPGFRRASDVDVLVPLKLTDGFHRALLREGYRLAGTRAYEHQLPALIDPDDVLIEIHRHIPGVRVDASFATADELLSAGLVRPQNRGLIPDHAVLAAHAVAHGFLQNAGTLRTHSPFRVLADLCDLYASDPSALSRATRFLRRELHEDDLAALDVLTRLALSGNLADAEGRPLELLRHCVASAVDENYGRSLSLRTVTQPLSQHGRTRATLNAIIVALFPDRVAMDALHGPSRPIHRRALDRLARPVVLLTRTASAARSRLRA